jgi:hypothetical protein
MLKVKEKLLGGDLRSISEANEVVEIVSSKEKFDELFGFLDEKDRLLRMRAMDAIEKISRDHPEFLVGHELEIVNHCNYENLDKEFKWHLALLLPRIDLKDDRRVVTSTLEGWVLNSKESKIVRVNSIQALYEFVNNNKFSHEEFYRIIEKVKKERIPSINARIKKFI